MNTRAETDLDWSLMTTSAPHMHAMTSKMPDIADFIFDPRSMPSQDGGNSAFSLRSGRSLQPGKFCAGNAKSLPWFRCQASV